jgi:hypothetical protein
MVRTAVGNAAMRTRCVAVGSRSRALGVDPMQASASTVPVRTGRGITMSSRGSLRSFVFASIVALVAAEGRAQRIAVDPGGVLVGGGSANVTFDDPSKAGQTVVVTASGGFPVVTVIEIVIVLDAKGKGTASWPVPTNWRGATFNGPGAAEVVRPIS